MQSDLELMGRPLHAVFLAGLNYVIWIKDDWWLPEWSIPDTDIECEDTPFSFQHVTNDSHVQRAFEMLKKWDQT